MEQLSLKFFSRYFNIREKFLFWALWGNNEKLMPVIRIDGTNAYIDILKGKLVVGINDEKFFDAKILESEDAYQFILKSNPKVNVVVLKSKLSYLIQ